MDEISNLAQVGTGAVGCRRDRAPRTTFDVIDITPKPVEQVSESTTIRATLQFKIEDFAAPPDKYTASLMFDSPMGNSGYFEDFGCQGATYTLTAASGTVTLECRLSEGWAKFKHSRRMVVHGVLPSLRAKVFITTSTGKPVVGSGPTTRCT